MTNNRGSYYRKRTPAAAKRIRDDHFAGTGLCSLFTAAVIPSAVVYFKVSLNVIITPYVKIMSGKTPPNIIFSD
jgi:hypothetical protein